MLTYVAYNVADDTDLFDNGREIVAFPHTPSPRDPQNGNYLRLLAEIGESQRNQGGYIPGPTANLGAGCDANGFEF